MKALLFFIAVILMLSIAYSSSKEGFTSGLNSSLTTKNEGTPSNCNSQQSAHLSSTSPQVPIAQLGVGNLEPSPAPASDLPSAPVGFISKEVPNPYRNPTNEPAKYIRLLAVKEDLQAFFGFESGSLGEKSDPAIQIPLTRARADMNELIDIQSVMERNPGLQSRINNKQLDDIKSNLNYLRQTSRDLEASTSGVEGFSNNVITKPKRATLKELQAFQIKVVVELKRLGASGTSDPLVQGRINTLTNIKNELDDVIMKLETGEITPETVPIYQDDIVKSLPILGQPNKPLPTILNKFSLPPAIASLFPGGMSPRDSEQATQINSLAAGYMKNLFEGASWGVNLNFEYDNPNKKKGLKKIGSNKTGSNKTGLKKTGLKKTGSNKTGSNKTGTLNTRLYKKGSPKRGSQRSTDSYRKNPKAIKHVVTYGIPGVNKCVQPIHEPTQIHHKTDSSHTSGLPGVSNRIYSPPKAGEFDWEKRSKEILKQVKKRGLNPVQFGAIPDNVEVSDEFSWRGYARMICLRLNTTTDPGLAFSCGCPHEDWEGWRT